MQISRLGPGDAPRARAMFEMFATVFETPSEVLGADYLQRLLTRADVWIVAAIEGDAMVGGVTAYTLPMTRSETAELFIYDLAVRTDHQRRGIGRALINELCSQAAAAGIEVSFVPADNDDAHALEFYRAIGGAPSPVTLFTFSRDR